MCAYMIVEPTNLKPRFFSSSASASDSFDVAGICLVCCHRFTIGLPPTNYQMNLSKLADLALDELEELLRVVHRRLDLLAVPHDAGSSSIFVDCAPA